MDLQKMYDDLCDLSYVNIRSQLITSSIKKINTGRILVGNILKTVTPDVTMLQTCHKIQVNECQVFPKKYFGITYTTFIPVLCDLQPTTVIAFVKFNPTNYFKMLRLKNYMYNSLHDSDKQRQFERYTAQVSFDLLTKFQNLTQLTWNFTPNNQQLVQFALQY